MSLTDITIAPMMSIPDIMTYTVAHESLGTERAKSTSARSHGTLR
jgi:hypothetical protein